MAEQGVPGGSVQLVGLDGSGNWVAVLVDATGRIQTSLYGEDAAAGDRSITATPLGRMEGSVCVQGTIADGQSNTIARFVDQVDTADIFTAIVNMLYDDGDNTWDRMRANAEVTLLASAARTADQNSPDFTNFNNNSGAILIIDVSAITASPVLTVKLQLKDPISGNYVDIWTATATLTAQGTIAYMFGLGGSGSAGDYTEGVNVLIPRTYRLRVEHADVDSATYSAAVTLLS